ncbi:MAG: DUF881 domain-containing protein [Clostridia bacterium]|nr:DUF881 domain-containing protein [Clostridia bacterium]
MKKIKAQLIIAIVLFVTSFVIVLQFKSVMRNTSSGGIEYMRADELRRQLVKEKETNVDLNRQLLQANSMLEAYRQDAQQNDSGARAMAAELQNSMTLAGLTDVEGEGVIITVNDSHDVPAGASSANYIVHDRDLRDIVNELTASGAEAISINGERICGRSSIRCVGPTITINNKHCAPPYIIKAIGNPSTLEAGLNIRDGVADIMRQFGIEVKIVKTNNVQIPKYNGNVTFQYAHVIEPTADGEVSE